MQFDRSRLILNLAVLCVQLRSMASAAAIHPKIDLAKSALIRAMASALMPENHSATSYVGLPVPPLLSLIAEYAAFTGTVITCVQLQHSPQSLCVSNEIDSTSKQPTEGGGGQHPLESVYVGGVGATVRRVLLQPPFSPSLIDGFVFRTNQRNSLCAHPTKPGVYFSADHYTIGCVTVTATAPGSAKISLIAGGKTGHEDLVGANARFTQISGMLCRPAGMTCGLHRSSVAQKALDSGQEKEQLFVIDSQRLRVVGVQSQSVLTICGDGRSVNADGTGMRNAICFPHAMCFDRSLPADYTNSVIYITAVNAIRRYSITTSEMTTVRVTNPPRQFTPYAIDSTRSGLLLVGCVVNHSLFTVNPDTGDVEVVAGTHTRGFADGDALTKAQFSNPVAVSVIDSIESAVVCDGYNKAVRLITLPPHLFEPATYVLTDD